MTFFAQVLFAWMILVWLHAISMALFGLLFGVRLQQISVGIGKVIFTRGVFTIRVVPISGSVRFKGMPTDENDEQFPTENESDTAGAFNLKPRIVQAVIPLAGSGMLVLVSFLVAPDSALDEVISGFRQIFMGALAPLSTAQHYINATAALAANAGFVALLGVLAAKVAAFNLLPFPWTNGGQAILALLRTDRTVAPPWQEQLSSIVMWPYLALVLMWVMAFFVFVMHSF